ncbi:uncharacterized protein TNCV_1962751 [Trichonephila clavipes]|nr:uncharacterized protein TNCV_1962751 [Trichonephila clavipes]
MVDLLAKRGTGILQRSMGDLRLDSAKLEINKKFLKKCFRDSTHAAAVAEFRLLTGHDCLCAHLYHFNLTGTLFCVLCASGQVMHTSHLDVCSALMRLNCIVKKY